MNYLSVCSGIEAATVAWHDLGFKPVGFSEIEPFPAAALKHHYPDVPNFGDMTKFKEWNLDPNAVDLLVGGTPCQSFSVAGLRKGLDDPRGNLALTYCAMLDHFRPKWFVWENVPGVLSSNGGRDFGSFLGAVAELGYGFSYRVLDAQYFVPSYGIPGNWIGRKPENGGNAVEPMHDVAPCLAKTDRHGVAHPVNIYGGNKRADRPEGGFYVRMDEETSKTLDAATGLNPTCSQGGTAVLAPSLTASNDPSRSPQSSEVTQQVAAVHAASMAVRRLTPIECERLQGFPDNYTNIPWRKKDESPDGPRYKALGNSMAVPVMRWIGQRIQQVESIK